MRVLLSLAATGLLGGCVYGPGYGYVRGDGYYGDAYYGDAYYGAPYGAAPAYYGYGGYYGPGYYYGLGLGLGFYYNNYPYYGHHHYAYGRWNGGGYGGGWYGGGHGGDRWGGPVGHGRAPPMMGSHVRSSAPAISHGNSSRRQ